MPSSASRIDIRWLGRWLGLALVWVLSGYYAAWHLLALLDQGFLGLDSHAYWLTGHTSGNLYTRPAQSLDAFLYSPVFALAVRPLTLLPYPVFAVLWATTELVLFVWLLKRGSFRWTVPLFAVACVPELILGNVYAFLATALVLAFAPDAPPSRAGALALPALTKICPGLTGLWFLVRMDTKRLSMAIATTASLVILSLLIAPHWWADYIHFMLHGDSHGTLWFPWRVAVAVVITVIAARSGRAALLPVAAIMSLPVLAGPSAFSLLAAVPRLRTRDVGEAEVSRSQEAHESSPAA
jgi:hypothetical protein